MTATVEPLAQATPEDIDDLVVLIHSLGYELDAESLAARLGRLDGASGSETWIVRGDDRRIRAVAGGHVMWAYNSDRPTAQLLLLVVSHDARRDGIGSTLLAHFEAWAQSHGAYSLSAVSAAAPETAHRFYQKRGYHESGAGYTKLG